MKTCPICSKTFATRYADQVACNLACGRILAGRRIVDSLPTQTCACGTVFRGRRSWCTKKCRPKPGRQPTDLLLSPAARFRGELTRDLTRLAEAELRDVRAAIVRLGRRPVLLEHERRLAAVVSRSVWASNERVGA